LQHKTYEVNQISESPYASHISPAAKSILSQPSADSPFQKGPYKGSPKKGAVCRRPRKTGTNLPAAAAPAVSALLLNVPQLGQLAVGGLHKLLQPVLEVGGLLGGLMDKAHGA